LKQKKDVTVFLESIVKSFQICKISFFYVPPWTRSHERKERFKEFFEYLYFAVSKLGGKKTCNFNATPVFIPMDELDGIIFDNVRKTFFFPFVDIFQINCSSLLLELCR